MNGILGVTLQSMQNDAARMERISMNMANALTPAYKREVIVEHTFGDLVQAGMNVDQQASSLEVVTDLRQGSFKVTGQSLDFAINGNAYFELSTPQGPVYTRQGNFHLDAQGRVVNQQGYPVMGKNGDIIVRSSKPVVDSNGQFIEDANGESGGLSVGSVGQFKLVEFEHGSDLIKTGDGMLTAREGVWGAQSKNAQIHQGQLENANINSMHEMVQVMQTMRHFESMQRITQGYDEMMGAAIRKLGDVS
ncbi:flagellar hook-basal body protein [Undibacterium sp. JH2W]|uniref:flagellar hook-basal body protein n=1 Tax=Undibacterium sp. JH2W TaxID=3413037 RepID=UPI003BF1D3D6